ncbi:MAG: amino acid ABC transporter permease [Treponema sp.]|nr:amino acid ABC transporter permease [Treponema sp.]
MGRPFNPQYIITVLPRLLAFLPVTLFIMAGTVFFGTILGFCLASQRLKKQGTGKRLAGAYAGAYITAMRCTPSIVLLFIVYYALPLLSRFFFGVNIDSMYRGVFVIVTLTLLFAANMAELMRSAYISVDPGQREAGLALGLGERKTFLLVILPQAAVAALPNFCNALLALMKEGALAYTIGMIDMMGQGTLIISRNYGAYGLEIYIALSLVYWALTILIERGFGLLERFLSRGKSSLETQKSSAEKVRN